MKVAAIIAAAGGSTRMGADKLLYNLCGISVIRRTVLAFCGLVDNITVVCASNHGSHGNHDNHGNRAQIEAELAGLNCCFCNGGATRSQSVKQALDTLSGYDIVLVHDGARPLIKPETIQACIAQTAHMGSAVTGVRVKDTIKQCAENRVLSTPARSELWQVQTPQGFGLAQLKAAYANPPENATDDASVFENAGYTAYMLEGSYENIKLTTPEDLLAAAAFLGKGKGMRVGNGYDVHAFAENRQLILCGETIPYERGLMGHSDADVAVHALMDALLGAVALRDIGFYFPDTNPQYKGANSMELLKRVLELLAQRGYRLVNADITIIAQAPKLSPYIEAMRANLATALGVGADCVGLKATTNEHLGFVGRKEGIAAQAVVLIEGC